MSPRMLFCIGAGLVIALPWCLSAGCTTVRTASPEGYSQLCESYVGQPCISLTSHWGYPGRTYCTREGGKVLVYLETQNEYALNPLAHAALIEYPPEMSRGKTCGGVTGLYVPSMDYCITYVCVDGSGRVTKVLWKGDCRALPR